MFGKIGGNRKRIMNQTMKKYHGGLAGINVANKLSRIGYFFEIVDEERFDQACEFIFLRSYENMLQRMFGDLIMLAETPGSLMNTQKKVVTQTLDKKDGLGKILNTTFKKHVFDFLSILFYVNGEIFKTLMFSPLFNIVNSGLSGPHKQILTLTKSLVPKNMEFLNYVLEITPTVFTPHVLSGIAMNMIAILYSRILYSDRQLLTLKHVANPNFAPISPYNDIIAGKKTDNRYILPINVEKLFEMFGQSDSDMMNKKYMFDFFDDDAHFYVHVLGVEQSSETSFYKITCCHFYKEINSNNVFTIKMKGDHKCQMVFPYRVINHVIDDGSKLANHFITINDKFSGYLVSVDNTINEKKLGLEKTTTNTIYLEVASDAYNTKNVENNQQTRLIILKTKNIGTKEEVLDRKKKTWIDVIEFYPIEDYLKEKDTSSGLTLANLRSNLSGTNSQTDTSSDTSSDTSLLDKSSVASSSNPSLFNSSSVPSSSDVSSSSFVTAHSAASSNYSNYTATSLKSNANSLFGAFAF